MIASSIPHLRGRPKTQTSLNKCCFIKVFISFSVFGGQVGGRTVEGGIPGAENACSLLRKQHVQDMVKGAGLSIGRHVGAADGGVNEDCCSLDVQHDSPSGNH